MTDKKLAAQPTLPADNGAEALKIEVCRGQAGLALYVNDTRVAGVRHNGLMETVLSAIVPAALSAPAPAQGEPVAWREFDHTTIDYVLRYGGRCRECADHLGICPSGLPCDVDDAKTAIRHVLKALNYGISHGFLAALSAPAPAQGAIADIAAERLRQIEAEGWSQDHDDAHSDGEMARAAGIYAVIAGSDRTDYRNATGGYSLNDILQGLMDHYWPWDRSWFKPADRRRDLVKAGALIVAEIERLDRLTAGVLSLPHRND